MHRRPDQNAAQRAQVPRLNCAVGAAVGAGRRHADVQLSVDDAIKLALDPQLDIAVQRLNPSTFGLLREPDGGSVSAPHNLAAPADRSVTNRRRRRFRAALAAGAGVPTPNLGQRRHRAGTSSGAAVRFVTTLNNNKATTTSTNSLFPARASSITGRRSTRPLLRNFQDLTTHASALVVRASIGTSADPAAGDDHQHGLEDIAQRVFGMLPSVGLKWRVARWNWPIIVRRDNKGLRGNPGPWRPSTSIRRRSRRQPRSARRHAPHQQGRAQTPHRRQLFAGPSHGQDDNPTDRPRFAPQPVDLAGPCAARSRIAPRPPAGQKNLSVNDVTEVPHQPDAAAGIDLVAAVRASSVLAVSSSRECTNGVSACVPARSRGQLPRLTVDALQAELSDVDVPVERPATRSAVSAQEATAARAAY